ncbi:MAG: hypothetical protein HYZ72_02100 [Deltaproteobacteria bacterium]|nr:hypothetical protein [Deltaproteobacteria bacterium]
MSRRATTNNAGKQVLGRIRQIKPFVEGSRTTTKKRCGHPRCRCAQEGPLHQATLLTWKEGHKTRTLYIPRELREEVATWVAQTKLLKRLIHQMSQAPREFLSSRKQRTKR